MNRLNSKKDLTMNMVFHDPVLDQFINFTDHKMHHHASKCRMQDIHIHSNVSLQDRKRLQSDIAVDIAINQGFNPIGIRRSL